MGLFDSPFAQSVVAACKRPLERLASPAANTLRAIRSRADSESGEAQQLPQTPQKPANDGASTSITVAPPGTPRTKLPQREQDQHGEHTLRTPAPTRLTSQSPPAAGIPDAAMFVRGVETRPASSAVPAIPRSAEHSQTVHPRRVSFAPHLISEITPYDADGPEGMDVEPEFNPPELQRPPPDVATAAILLEESENREAGLLEKVKRLEAALESAHAEKGDASAHVGTQRDRV